MLVVEERDERFYISASTIPNAGRGLFAAVPLKKGDYIDVIGVMIKADSVAYKATYWADNYKFAATDPEYRIVPLGYAGMINHGNTPESRNLIMKRVGDSPRFKKKKKELSANERQYSLEVVYEFSRDIEKGEELLADYGPSWNAQRAAISEVSKVVTQQQTEWEKFLALRLYNFPQLVEKLPLP